MIRTRTRTLAVTTLVAAALGVSGCASTPAEEPTQSPSVQASTISGELTIYAAASLQAAFDDLAEAFEQDNPEVEVLPIVYDGSSTLAAQLQEGAPADVFASANEPNMQKVVDAGLASSDEIFATNTLVIAVPDGNPGGITGLEDLARDDLTVVLCAPEVPCGTASQDLLTQQGIEVTPASFEQNVTAVRTKVGTGEADAGLVYTTDVAVDDSIEGVEASGADEIVNRYPIVALDDAPNRAAADAFVEFVLGEAGQDVLTSYGFGMP